MHRKLGVIVVAATLAFAAAACGSSGPEVSSRDRSSTPHAAAAGAANGSGTQTVTYQGVAFDVPAGWPVYDLTADPTTCVRYDVHAVYLGHAGADMQCPAHLSGRTATVQVEALDGQQLHADATGDDTAGVTTEDVNGLSVSVDPGTAATHEFGVSVPAAGVAATITYADTDTDARQILQSFRAAG